MLDIKFEDFGIYNNYWWPDPERKSITIGPESLPHTPDGNVTELLAHVQKKTDAALAPLLNTGAHFCEVAETTARICQCWRDIVAELVRNGDTARAVQAARQMGRWEERMEVEPLQHLALVPKKRDKSLAAAREERSRKAELARPKLREDAEEAVKSAHRELREENDGAEPGETQVMDRAGEKLRIKRSTVYDRLKL